MGAGSKLTKREMTEMKLTLAAALGATLVSTFATVAPAMAWEQVGVLNVGEHFDIDVVKLSGNREFRRIKVCAYRQTVHMIDIDIWFRNGGHQDVNTRYQITPATCTREIYLTGGRRNIDRIVFKYAANSWRNGTAIVRVFAD
jgi:hypothetical protein